MPKEKLPLIGQFGARGTAFKWERSLAAMPKIARWKQSSSVGVNSVESPIK